MLQSTCNLHSSLHESFQVLPRDIGVLWAVLTRVSLQMPAPMIHLGEHFAVFCEEGVEPIKQFEQNANARVVYADLTFSDERRCSWSYLFCSKCKRFLFSIKANQLLQHSEQCTQQTTFYSEKLQVKLLLFAMRSFCL